MNLKVATLSVVLGGLLAVGALAGCSKSSDVTPPAVSNEETTNISTNVETTNTTTTEVGNSAEVGNMSADNTSKGAE